MIPAVCAGPGIPGLVSVLIPTYNRAYIICSAIDSVLAQTYKKIEVVVVDDGSTDNTRELLARYGDAVRYIYQPNAGLAAARNTGLAAARGEFIALQDSDDLWLPWKIEGQMAVMALDQRIGLCWTDLTAVNPKGEVVRERNLRPAYDVYSRIRFADHFDTSGMLHDAWQGCPEALRDTRYHFGDVYSAMFLGNLVHPPTALMRRTHVAKAGGLDGTYARTCEDYEFFWRVSAHGLGALVDAPGMLYRVEAGDQLTHPGMMVYLARGNAGGTRSPEAWPQGNPAARRGKARPSRRRIPVAGERRTAGQERTLEQRRGLPGARVGAQAFGQFRLQAAHRHAPSRSFMEACERPAPAPEKAYAGAGLTPTSVVARTAWRRK